MGHAAGSEGWLGHYLTWFVPGVGEFFHFTWGLERKQGPCVWGIITFFFYSKTNAPYLPGVGVSIDRCIKEFQFFRIPSTTEMPYRATVWHNKSFVKPCFSTQSLLRSSLKNREEEGLPNFSREIEGDSARTVVLQLKDILLVK